MLLETVNKVKWKTAESVEEEEEEEKVCVEMRCLLVLHTPCVCLKLTVTLCRWIPCVGLCSRGDAPAKETGRVGERSVGIKATTGN